MEFEPKDSRYRFSRGESRTGGRYGWLPLLLNWSMIVYLPCSSGSVIESLPAPFTFPYELEVIDPKAADGGVVTVSQWQESFPRVDLTPFVPRLIAHCTLPPSWTYPSQARLSYVHQTKAYATN